MAGRKSDFTLTKLDDLFTTQAQREEEKLSKIRDIPLGLIDDFPDHPFKVRDDEDMLQLIESIRDRGVITPATVRQKEDGRYELISGHRRKVGIFYRGSDVERQFLYVMGDMENDTRTHHIHIVKWNGTEWKNYIHFRDYLNDNENMALQYQKVKEELESKYADDRVAYTNGKQDMIDLILDNQ